MCIVQIESPDELVQKLAPYRDKLAELLELGLEQYINRERRACLSPREQVLHALAVSGRVELPRPVLPGSIRERHTPIRMAGKPLSEIIIEQRGDL